MGRYSYYASGDVNTDNAVVLTNKTINRPDNTLTNLGIVNADVDANAAIDVSKLSGVGNSSNLLAGISPTKSGFDTNPGTDADITDELGLTSITTSGTTVGAGTATITYDLGSSKRVIAMAYAVGLNLDAVTIKGSDNNSDFFSWAYGGGTGIIHWATSAGKARYLQFMVSASDVLSMATLELRAYTI